MIEGKFTDEELKAKGLDVDNPATAEGRDKLTVDVSDRGK